jgi:hypothetical protein
MTMNAWPLMLAGIARLVGLRRGQVANPAAA